MSNAIESDPHNVANGVVICYALPDRAWIKWMPIHSDSSVGELVEQSGFFKDHPKLVSDTLAYGIFGKKVSPGTRVGHGDRIEIYRSLIFDPKESRRRRAAHRAALNKQRKTHASLSA